MHGGDTTANVDDNKKRRDKRRFLLMSERPKFIFAQSLIFAEQRAALNTHEPDAQSLAHPDLSHGEFHLESLAE